MPRIISAIDAARMARPGMRIYIAGCTAEPVAVLDAAEQSPHCWQGVHVFGTFIPGVNNRDYACIGGPQAVSCLFPTQALRRSRQIDCVQFPALNYWQWSEYLQSKAALDIAYFQVSKPDEHGQVSLGVTADFIPALLSTRCKFIGVINPRVPALAFSPSLSVDRFAAFVESDTPLPELITRRGDPEDCIFTQIASHIVSILDEGDVLQLGLGKLQQALMPQLAGLSGLGLFGGMISDGVPELMSAGVLSQGVTAGVALGSSALYSDIAALQAVAFKPVAYTHHAEVLASIKRFVAINSVLEIDLQGQVNAEFLNRQRVTAMGGMGNFIQGAKQSVEGRSILALPSTANAGRVSRIVRALADGQPVSIARKDVQFVVTEYGVADLREATDGDVKQRLRAIAHPDFRSNLC